MSLAHRAGPPVAHRPLPPSAEWLIALAIVLTCYLLTGGHP